jgi:hypothetical protein
MNLSSLSVQYDRIDPSKSLLSSQTIATISGYDANGNEVNVSFPQG